jgi:hypothetical protein
LLGHQPTSTPSFFLLGKTLEEEKSAAWFVFPCSVDGPRSVCFAASQSRDAL